MSERSVAVTIGGVERHLRFTIAAVKEAQRVGDKAFGVLLGTVLVFDVNAMSLLLWAALRHEDHKLTLAGADEVLQAWVDDGAGLEEISEHIMRCAKVSGFLRPDKPEPGKGEAPPSPLTSGQTQQSETPISQDSGRGSLTP